MGGSSSAARSSNNKNTKSLNAEAINVHILEDEVEDTEEMLAEYFNDVVLPLTMTRRPSSGVRPDQQGLEYSSPPKVEVRMKTISKAASVWASEGDEGGEGLSISKVKFQSKDELLLYDDNYV